MKQKSKKLPSYKQPPVNEVACGILFDKIETFRAHHFGLFWNKIKKDFPICEHATRTMAAVPRPMDVTNYMPKIWFISQEQNKLIQLQDDCLFYNWRKTQQDETYPSYGKIIKSFKSNLNKFGKFLEEQGLGLISHRECELTYVNIIPKGKDWKNFGDRIFRDFAWGADKRFLPEPIGIGWQAIFPLENNKGQLTATLQTKERKSDKKSILVLQISAKGSGSDKAIDAVWDWFETAHEWIVRGFTDLTDEKIQNEIWQRTR